ncbi:MAG: transglycosylase family protein, partial [Actinomycetota bacterium]
MLNPSASTFFRRPDDREPPPTAGPSGRGRLRRMAVAAAVCVSGAVVYAAAGPISTAGADPSANDWFLLRMCESGNNYAINTGNDHYGAYQFDLLTWRSVGGSGYPQLASPAEQDARALMLYRMRGWQPWQCAGIVGLQEDADARSGRISDITIPGSTPAPAPSSGAVAPAWPGPRYFSFGDQSTTIKRWQDQMHARGVFPVGTGYFGPNTLAVVKRLQGQNGLPQTGILGPVTWQLAWTGRYVAPPTTSAPAWPGPRYFSFGDQSTTIKRWQDQMHARGVFPVGTGYFGPN